VYGSPPTLYPLPPPPFLPSSSRGPPPPCPVLYPRTVVARLRVATKHRESRLVSSVTVATCVGLPPPPPPVRDPPNCCTKPVVIIVPPTSPHSPRVHLGTASTLPPQCFSSLPSPPPPPSVCVCHASMPPGIGMRADKLVRTVSFHNLNYQLCILFTHVRPRQSPRGPRPTAACFIQAYCLLEP